MEQVIKAHRFEERSDEELPEPIPVHRVCSNRLLESAAGPV